MRHHPSAALSIGLACALLSSATQLVLAQEVKPKAVRLAQGHRPNGLAVEAMRREVEARRKQQEQAFAKLRELVPAPAQAPRARIVQVQDPAAVVIRRAMLLRKRDGLKQGDKVIVAELILEQVEKPPEGQDDLDEDGSGNRVVPPRHELIVLSETFDYVLFTGDTPDERRGRLNDHLTRRIRAAERAKPLTTAQKQKLQLAGQGDIKRFFDRVEEKRQEFERVRADLNKCGAFVRELRPLRREYVTGPFDEGSLFAKTFRKLRGDEPVAQSHSP
jgi:hypothetical protein